MPSAKKKDKKVKGTDEQEVLKGVYMFPNGDKYDGEYKTTEGGSLERNGQGVHTTAEGMVYDGQWVADKMNGLGRLTHPSGSYFEGEFVNNMFHGRGKYVWPNHSYYEGQFVENKLQGEGQFIDTDGQVWVGTFRYKAAPGLRFRLNLG